MYFVIQNDKYYEIRLFNTTMNVVVEKLHLLSLIQNLCL